jgi:hypothetical protein
MSAMKIRRADVPARRRPVGARRPCLHPSAQRSVIRRMHCVMPTGSSRKAHQC